MSAIAEHRRKREAMPDECPTTLFINDQEFLRRIYGVVDFSKFTHH